MAQVHLRYVNDQPRATILHAWIDIFRENSGFFPEFFDIFAQLFLKNSSSPVKTRICRGFWPVSHSKTDQINRTNVQLNDRSYVS